ncbi:GNAT family N-acetyltransferase [Halococcus sp. AFM35]|uniref:GNAT family N-acetyltransferase n=1 Tax=Halococcus sp. AFM35 TaxID=3421653 RepID=UPI003EB9FFDA
MSTGIHIRQARQEDYEAVAGFTRGTWADREASDYIPEIYHEWIASDGERQRTFVADAGDDIAGICQGVLLSDHEAWAQGMRVNPDYRGTGLSTKLNDALFAWARERGATCCRNMVFSWNTAGLGGSRAAGFDPRMEFRWAHPNPDPGRGSAGTGYEVVNAPDDAWGFWQRSEARNALGGLALDRNESWAVSELTRERLRRAADETRVFAVQGADGTRGMAHRVRDYEREQDGKSERWAEYGVGAWADLDAARALFDAISADAAKLDADRTRVLIPETPRHVSDAAAARIAVSGEPDFVLEAPLF